MRVAFAAAELSPNVQVGGLADVARWLPAALAADGDDVRVFIPHYDVLDPADLPVRPVEGLGGVPIGGLGSVTVSQLGDSGPGTPTIYLVAAARWFERGTVYDTAPDEHLRFAAFSRAVIEVCDRLRWLPDVIHANDWHTALLPMLRTAVGASWATIPVVLTLHNLAYQGWFPATDLEQMGLDPEALAPAEIEDGRVNSLRAGIRTASSVTTVSPTYAREITDPRFGFGLDADLRAREDRLVGILNGIGPDWDPATDELIPHPYADRSGKGPNIEALRTRVGLIAGADVPVLGIVSRLDPQKGFELLRTTMPPIVESRRAQLAVLGTGDSALENFFFDLADRYPGWVSYEKGFDRALGHLIEAGSHIFLMPSQFEPCGLNQMYSMRYGTVPVVHRVGGLADTVEQWDPRTGSGTGFAFDEYSAGGFMTALESALDTFGDSADWARLMDNGMAGDFSWERRALEYRAVYTRALGLQD